MANQQTKQESTKKFLRETERTELQLLISATAVAETEAIARRAQLNYKVAFLLDAHGVSPRSSIDDETGEITPPAPRPAS